MTRITILHTEILREKLLESPMTFDQMAEAVGLSKAAVQRWIKSMREANRVYVSGYAPDKNGRPFVPLHRWGVGENAKRPGQTIKPADRMRAKRAAEQTRKSLIGKMKP